MQIAPNLDPIFSSTYDIKKYHNRNQGRDEGQSQDDRGKNSQSTTTTRSLSSTSIRSSLNQSPTNTQNLPNTSPIGFPSPKPIPVSTTQVAIQVTQSTIQTIINPTQTVVSSATFPSQSSTKSLPFLFNNLKNATVCGSLDLTWVYNGQARVAITLVVQNQVGTTISAPMSSQPTPSVTFRTLTTDAPSDANGYTWAPVDVNEGWYTAKAFDTGALLGISAQSMPFFVLQNQDHPSCLITGNISTSIPTAPSSIPTHDGRSVLGTGDIIGVTLGVSAGIFLLVVAFMFPRLWRRELPDPKTRRPYLLY